MSREPWFKYGDRVRLNEIARERGIGAQRPGHFDRIGTVIGFSRDGHPRVRWDGIKADYPYSPLFLSVVVPRDDC